MKKLALLFGLLFAMTASADTVNVTVKWILPTTNVDGTPVVISSVLAEYGTCNGTDFGTKQGQASLGNLATQTTFGLQPGTYCFRVTVTTNRGAVSVPSNIGTITIPPPPQPNPATITSPV